jgi:5-methylcytosine-specific restriction endonuclease McrA
LDAGVSSTSLMLNSVTQSIRRHLRSKKSQSSSECPTPGKEIVETAEGCGVRLEKVDFLRTRELRQAIHAREGGKCFYCLRQTPKRAHCLDHVVPQAKYGRNSYRNLVSCCMDCNSRKGAHSAGDHLRRLLREGRLTPREFNGRQRALKAVAAGRLRPPLSVQAAATHPSRFNGLGACDAPC